MKEYFRTLVENSRIDYLGVLQWVWSRGKRSAQPQFYKDKRGFTTKELDGVHGWKITKTKPKG